VSYKIEHEEFSMFFVEIGQPLYASVYYSICVIGSEIKINAIPYLSIKRTT
jgi:hypothetical protein